MNEYKVGICDSDTYYVMGVMEYINLNESIPIKIFAFSNLNSIEDYIRRNKLDMLLLDEKFEYNDTSILIFKLTDIRENSSKNGKIYKYQNIENISFTILKILDNKRLNTKNGNYVYGIYSPLGRCGKTSLAKGICNYYKDSLYIGFEAFAGGLPEDMESYRTLYEHFMYYLISENIRINEVIDKMNHVNGYRSFIALDYKDLKSVSTENIKWLTDTLRYSNEYRRIVYDINAGVMDIRVMLAVDRIYVPVLKDRVSADKIDRFEKMIAVDYSELVSKVNYIEVPDADWDSGKIRELIMKGDI
ncbi:MAG: hypothetical protein IJV15_07800 [Lachnospiraceae bacterium]|nr:hypothetical protein [Lachnospiraceae bacterium]